MFALLDEFDSIDTSKLPFVRVVRTEGNNRWERDGFLEETDGKRFRVRYLDLGRDVLEFTKEDFWRPGIAFEPADMRDAVARAIADAKDRRENGYIQPVAELLLLARACARRGMHGEVDALWEQIGSVAEGCRNELGWYLGRRLDLEIADPRLTWTDLLARHEKWLELFANNQGAVREFADDFQESVRERRDAIASLLESKRARDKARAGREASPADLVFDLHDEFHLDAGPVINARSVEPPEPAPTDGSRPVDRLLALDLAAVPSLIEALGDKSPTRCLVAGSKGELFVQSLGDLAELVLIDIAGTRLARPGDDVAAAWREWLARTTKEGPRKQLEEGVAMLDGKAISVFLRRWPRDLDTVIAAMNRAGPDKVRAWLFDVLFEAPGLRTDNRVTALCIAFARESSLWETRLHLAHLLFKQGNPGGVAPVLATWQRLLRESRLGDPDCDPHGYMLQFLVQSGDLATWRAIAETCSNPEARLSLARQFLRMPWRAMQARVRAPELQEVESQVLGCLLHLLGDDARLGYGVQFQHAGRSVSLHEASCADIAACVLAANWPKEYAFDAARTASERRRQIQALRNATPHHPPRPATAAGAEEQAGLRANRVERVSIEASAAGLEAAAQERIRTMHGKTLTATSLIELMKATAASAKGNGVVCRCERSGRGDGTSLSVAFLPPTNDLMQFSSADGGCSIRLLVTAGGVELGDENGGFSSRMLDRVEDQHYGKFCRAIEKALRSDASTGVEILFAVRLP